MLLRWMLLASLFALTSQDETRTYHRGFSGHRTSAHHRHRAHAQKNYGRPINDHSTTFRGKYSEQKQLELDDKIASDNIWAPIRSTISPPTEFGVHNAKHQKKPRVHARKNPGRTQKTHNGRSAMLTKNSHGKNSKNHKLPSKKVYHTTEMVLPAQNKAAHMLSDIINNEMESVRKNTLMKKIHDAKMQIDRLAKIMESKVEKPKQPKQPKQPKKMNQMKQMKRVKQPFSGKSENEKFTEMAIRRKLAERNAEKYRMLNGLLEETDKGPLPRFTIGKNGQKKSTATKRTVSEGISDDGQVKVMVSPIIFEGTKIPTMLVGNQWNRTYMLYDNHIVDMTDLDTTWKHRRPIRPPTLMYQSTHSGETAQGTAIQKNIFLSESLLASGTTPDAQHSLTALPSHAESSIQTTNDLIGDVEVPPPYPFSHCYMNTDGFMCCNRYLETLMRNSYRHLKQSTNFHECSVQKIATQLQLDSEQVFNTTFEAIVGIDDFALRAHFAGDLMCKIEEDGRFITAYATAMPTRQGVIADPLNVITPLSMDLQENKVQENSPVQTPLTTTLSPSFLPKGRGKSFHEMSREEVRNEIPIR